MYFPLFNFVLLTVNIKFLLFAGTCEWTWYCTCLQIP